VSFRSFQVFQLLQEAFKSSNFSKKLSSHPTYPRSFQVIQLVKEAFKSSNFSKKLSSLSTSPRSFQEVELQEAYKCFYLLQEASPIHHSNFKPFSSLPSLKQPPTALKPHPQSIPMLQALIKVP
jgi:hypothetical protein